MIVSGLASARHPDERSEEESRPGVTRYSCPRSLRSLNAPTGMTVTASPGVGRASLPASRGTRLGRSLALPVTRLRQHHRPVYEYRVERAGGGDRRVGVRAMITSLT